MKKINIISFFLLVLTTIIWGSAFIFQDKGMEFVQPLTFNVFRCLACTIFLVIVSFIQYIIKKRKRKYSADNYKKKDLVIGGLIIGVFTCGALATQQIGISILGAGRSGFITSLYIIFVPLIGLVFGKKINPLVLIAIVFSLTGLYFINVTEDSFVINEGTLWLLGCALFYALQIVAIGFYSNKCDSIKLTAAQFFIAGVLEIPLMFIFENPEWISIYKALIPILYCGILSSGVAFTLQVFTQKYIEPTIASMIMALESVFAIFFAYLILNESYTTYEIIGCILIFISIIITQIPYKKKENKNQN